LASELQYKRRTSTLRISESIDIDGQLNEEVWADAESVTDFITWSPNPGLQPDKQTVVKVMYADNAMYIGAVLDEEGRDNIKTQLAQRDELGEY